MTKTEICKLFGTSMDNLNKQYRDNAQTLLEMAEKAKLKGKYNGYTHDQLIEQHKKFLELSKS